MLIDKTEIAKHREVARNVRDDKINPYISDAQLLDLRPLLGQKLYMAIVKDPEAARFNELMDPYDFEINEVEYNHQGLKKVLSIFSYARYVIHGSFTDTAFGFVQKSNQDSSPVSESSKRNIYQQDRQTATTYFQDIALYLNNNTDIYPEWKSDCSRSPHRGFRISKITR